MSDMASIQPVKNEQRPRDADQKVITGACLCGTVSFEVTAPLPKGDACHCAQCRRWSGHFFASVDVKRTALTVQHDKSLSWYQSSEKVRRGFCQHCGSSLFFDPVDRQKHDWIGVALGAFDSATQTELEMHIFVEEQGDYYTLNDGVKQNRR